MRRSPPAWGLLLALCAPAEVGAQYPQAQRQFSVQLSLDGLYRREWTRDFLDAPDQRRWRLQLRPRVELGVGGLRLGAGLDLNHSQDRNVEPRPALLRDNYASRDARLDLAFASLKPAGWLQLQGGRFVMPAAFTEMLWDRDLRPQGAALTLESHDGAGLRRFALTALGARGSHVFEDGKTDMLALSAELAFGDGGSLTGSFVRFTGTGSLEPMLRRQNTRVAGQLTRRYEVVDVVARFRREGAVSTQLVADYAWNTGAADANRGLWLALVLGSVQSARARLEYTYAKVDKDATLAAYATDDFFWATGWEGHRLDLGLRTSAHSSLHGVGQLQRFKDSPRPEERDHFIRRYRVDLRIRY